MLFLQNHKRSQTTVHAVNLHGSVSQLVAQLRQELALKPGLYIRSTCKDETVGVDMCISVVDMTDALVVQSCRRLPAVGTVVWVVDGVDGHYFGGVSQRRPSWWFWWIPAIRNRGWDGSERRP